MAELSELDAAGDRVGLNYWLRTDWLDRAQVAEVLGDLGVGLHLGATPEQDEISEHAIEEAERHLEFVAARTALADVVERDPTDEFERAPTSRDDSAFKKFDSTARTIVHQSVRAREAVSEEPVLDEITEAEDFRRDPTLRFTADDDSTGALSSPFGYASTVIRSGIAEIGVRRPIGLDAEDTAENPRYVLGRELGRGGGGRVVRAFDRMLGRTVAMKVLRREVEVDDAIIDRFVAEAQATGQLEHPNIVPVYDFGVLPTGEVFYTMREVRRQSLRAVLNSLRQGDPATASEYTLVKLVSILRQICQAVDYAHSRGVVHRDLKPDNVMLGDFGEVLVMDWGLARVLETGVQTSPQSDEAGHTLGTPAYMSPEQARGDLDRVDERSDVYSLGAILYETLTLEPPFLGENAVEVMWNVVEADLTDPAARAPDGRPVPEELERICQRALERDRDLRFRTVREFHNALEDWLEGVQSYEAAQKVAEGEHAARLFSELERVVASLREEVREARTSIEAWESVDRKRTLWDLEDQLEQALVSSARAFGDAVAQFTQALAYQNDNGRARAGLARLYWERAQQARREGNIANEIYFEALVRQYDQGKFVAQLDNPSTLRVETVPSGAQIECFRFEEADRRLVATADYDLGVSPTAELGLEPGCYLLVVQHPDSISFRQPISLERATDVVINLELPNQDDAQAGFVYVPKGPAILGGDALAFDARPEQVVDIDAFYCAQFPVTFRQYLEFLNELHAEDPDLALERAPQTRGSDGFLVRFDQREGLWVPDEILIEGPARARYPVGEAHEYEIPVVGIRAADAEAYCQWRSAKDGRNYRLPLEEELEKAGRGVDGRYFPWGNRFDATFCKMRFSRPDLPQLEPVGVFVDDASPYGVRDLGGGVQEWCAADQDPDDNRIVKGGAWNQDSRPSRMASRVHILAGARAAGVGFRLVYSP